MGGYWQLVFVSCLLVQSLSAEDSVKDNSISPVNDNAASAVNTDEELEKKIGQRIASLREMGRDEILNFSNLALESFHSQVVDVFTTLEDATMTFKKAIGSMMYLRTTVEKTNCTKKDVSSFSLHPKYCAPLAGEDKEQLECKFDIFKDERSEGEEVVSHDCKPVKMMDRSFLLGENPN